VIKGVENLQKALNTVAILTWIVPAPGQSAADYVNRIPLTTSKRTANHWIGNAKMGTDDGRSKGGTAVVDTNTKVYGTDNLFVVDASIFPGMVTTNPSALIVTAAEHAGEKILGLPVVSAVARYGQCGGSTYNGNCVCVQETTCTW
jgi:cellobiose dehydrogenase (acceptor)